MNSARRIVQQTRKPAADLDVDRDRAGHRAQHEADRKHVSAQSRMDDVLQNAGVERLEHDVGNGDRGEAASEHHRRRKRGDPEHRGDARRQADADRPGRNRPLRLERMLAMALAIEDVVDDGTPRRTARSKDREGGASRAPRSTDDRVSRCPEQQAREHEQVLGPLIRTQREEEVQRRAVR